MRLLSSLRKRIFFASAAVTVLSVAFAGRVVTARVSHQLDAELQRGLERSARLVAQQHETRGRQTELAAHLIADLPRLKAAVATGDPPTVEPIAADYRGRARADLFAVTDGSGRVLAALGATSPPESQAVQRALAGGEATSFQLGPGGGILQLVTVPIHIGPDPAEVLGTLTLGFALDDALAAQLEALTESDVAFALGGRVRAASLPADERVELTRALEAHAPVLLEISGRAYLARGLRLGEGEDAPVAVVLRSHGERLVFLSAFRTGLFAAACVAVLLGVLLSYAVARSVTRPLALLTATMRDLADTGDLGRRLQLGGRWYDEDAIVVARSFNSLLEALARFQREATRRQRLSALGRLSAVVAHEVRNPLMVIKSSLPVLRRSGAPDDVREAADDIDREVARLDRIVRDVLDYTREMRLDFGPVELDALCRDAAAAALTGEPRVAWALDLPSGLPPCVTDAERLRGVLVTLLTNAREAVCAARAAPPPPDAAPEIELRVETTPDARVVITVDDRGPGIAEADLPHVFEPYFTTKRSGSGLGLAIARNVVEALGGTLGAQPRPGGGASLRLELPLTPPARG